MANATLRYQLPATNRVFTMNSLIYPHWVHPLQMLVAGTVVSATLVNPIAGEGGYSEMRYFDPITKSHHFPRFRNGNSGIHTQSIKMIKLPCIYRSGHSCLAFLPKYFLKVWVNCP